MVFYATSLTYLSKYLTSCPLACRDFITEDHSCLDDFSSFAKDSPGALNFCEFLFSE